ncbi:DUF692 domain-containing protein [Rubrivivax rivuli]|uniref:DUF692 domain-containing protein n=1 Tax=Rubrivivax rivuli TaxID=1862385 RepID=A0A437RCC7_9BURK|nr:DUF692 domain-containing protein [Rubrivivax rivuli]RVU44439.1 DUF692 domain-containing protein [Rubrivivax rivuli]
MTAPARSGIGLRQPHGTALLEAPPPLGFVEVHAENYFGAGGAALAQLQAARERWPLSLHGVGLGLGSAAGLDAAHLQQLAALVRRFEPVLVSEHACFARAPRRSGGPVVHGNDLLPIAFNAGSLALLAANVQQAQDALRRPLLLENLSAYVHWADDTLAEPEFFNELARRTGCGMLLDVNNLVVNALNQGLDEAGAAEAACRWVDALTPGIVGEIHLAGYAVAEGIVIDDHGSRVHAPVWQAYRHALRRLGWRPTLVEWDTDLPALPVLLAEAAAADAAWAEVAGPVQAA